MSSFKQYFLKLLFITSSMLILSAPFILLQIYYPQSAHSVNGFITEHFWEFTVLRLLLIAGIIMIWPVCIQHYGENQEWTDAKIQYWLSQRFRIAGWMAVVELLVCQNILACFF